MPEISPLPASRLHATYNPARIPWEDSTKIPQGRHAKNGYSPLQPRAMHALDLALQIKDIGYHVYLSGEANLGRSHMLLNYLSPHAKHLPTPPDLVYVQNFADPDAPILLNMEAGEGKKFKAAIKELIENIAKDLDKRIETLTFAQKKTKLQDQFQNERSTLLNTMKGLAVDAGFNLEIDNGSIALVPLLNGKKLSEDEYGNLDASLRKSLKRKGDNLAKELVGYLKKLNQAEQSLHDDERNLEEKAMSQTLASLLTPLENQLLKANPSAKLSNYLKALRNDILKNTEAFLYPEQPSKKDDQHSPQIVENFFNRYEVNLFVDNSQQEGAPIIMEDNPTQSNLLGCVERESELGALVTDFTLIRSGSLHRANGGFLAIHVEDILQRPGAWEGLLRSLRANQARIEDGSELQDSPVRTKGLRPEPLDLDIKIILIGCEDIYETLLENEDRFSKLFKIKAHMTDSAERSAANIKIYLTEIAQIIKEDNLLPFNPAALAWLVDLGSHLCEDQKRISLKFPLLREQMIEANALAKISGLKIVDAEILEKAYSSHIYRSNLVEEIFMEEYDRKMIKVQTSGSSIGQVNGLSLTWHGDFEFGLPHRISCAVGVGNEGIIDLEREAELGGPIHTKAMMILKSFLTNLFARKKPLVLSASLYFEQSYAGIEGDSASGAELVALLSALADVPVRLDLAFTGAVSHTGEIMAVGGVTRKIEGFYKVCARHGLTGTQGVIIPYDNIDHLMLSTDILQSVEQNQFAIYPVRDIEDAIFLLTGLPAGKRHKNGTFTAGSLYDLADRRLEKLGCFGQNAFRRQRKD